MHKKLRAVPTLYAANDRQYGEKLVNAVVSVTYLELGARNLRASRVSSGATREIARAPTHSGKR